MIFFVDHTILGQLGWLGAVGPWMGLAAIVVIGGVLWMWPRGGLRAVCRRNRERNQRIAFEDALKNIYNEWVNGQPATLSSVAGHLQYSISRTAELLGAMEKKNLGRFQNGALRLTSEGRRYALHVIRAHRLWERYLAEETGFGETEWHRRAELSEHDLTPEQVEALSVQLNHPSHDPHGDPIPTATGHLDAAAGQPLTTLEVEGTGRILHLEDEPPSIYAQLTALGLQPGLEVRILEKGPDHVRFWVNGDEHLLATLLANNVTVIPLAIPSTGPVPGFGLLSGLKVGQTAKVHELSPACRGADRRRLLDLGFVPGAEVTAEMSSPAGDPVAYRIRGTLIALRREQASLIRVALNGQALAA
jgi:DtxR family transcriptional regulator, Mn-dependent transcriptional regulator